MTHISQLFPLEDRQVVMVYVLAAIYIIILFLLLFSYMKIDHRSTLLLHKKAYHFLLILAVCCRVPFFSYRPTVTRTNSNVIIFTLLTRFCWFFFLLTFSLFLLLWIKLYHQALADSVSETSSKRKELARKLFVFSFIGIFLSSIFIGFIFQVIDVYPIVQDIISYIVAALNFIVAAGFLWYGIHLFILLRRVFMSSIRRSRVIRRITAVTCVCTFCFLLRSGILFFEIYCAHSYCSSNAYFIDQITFYTLGEVFPILSMMLLTRMHSQLQFKQRNETLLNEYGP
eukprot:c14392_g1_i2.p1 GENE.c14392_g1_i2~~c14392_g1_i2.p1  ORF type:complete len:285 (+),score=42.54 c14392_g1_i2:54-908(+)